MEINFCSLFEWNIPTSLGLLALEKESAPWRSFLVKCSLVFTAPKTAQTWVMIFGKMYLPPNFRFRGS
jgi:hypothetical protein